MNAIQEAEFKSVISGGKPSKEVICSFFAAAVLIGKYDKNYPTMAKKGQTDKMWKITTKVLQKDGLKKLKDVDLSKIGVGKVGVINKLISKHIGNPADVKSVSNVGGQLAEYITTLSEFWALIHGTEFTHLESSDSSPSKSSPSPM